MLILIMLGKVLKELQFSYIMTCELVSPAVFQFQWCKSVSSFHESSLLFQNTSFDTLWEAKCNHNDQPWVHQLLKTALKKKKPNRFYFSKFLWFCLLVFNKLQSFARKRNQEVSSIFSLLNSVVIRIRSHMILNLCVFQFLKKCQHGQVYLATWGLLNILKFCWVHLSNCLITFPQFACCKESFYKRENPSVIYILLVVYKFNRYLLL